MKLRPYQTKCLNKILKKVQEWVRLQVIVLSTGTGKTVIFARLPEIVKQLSNKKTLVLAHREELLQQAKEKIQTISPELKVEIEQGLQKAEPDADVIIASVATLWRAWSERIKKFNPWYFWLIIIDECHHSTASTYKNVLNYFWANKEEGVQEGHPVVLWVTATPNRRDNIWLDTLFDELVFKYELKEAIQDGYLSNIKAFTIFTNESLEDVSVRMWDFAIWELSNAVNTPIRNKLVVETYKNKCNWDLAIVFAVDVQHAKDLSEEFGKSGISSEYISWETPKDERRDILDKFKKWKIQVLTNCQILTEGFDCPEIKAVLMARPTTSQSLFKQCIGRGTRLAPWKEHVKILDFVDNLNKHNVISSSTLIWLDKPIKADWEDLFEYEDKFNQILSSNPDEDVSKLDLSRLDERIQEVDIFNLAKTPGIIKENSSLSRQMYLDWFKLSLGKKDDISEYVIIRENLLGQYEVNFYKSLKQEPSYKNGYKKARRDLMHTFNCSTKIDALKQSDKYIRENHPSVIGMLRQSASWRQDGPTEKQMGILKKAWYNNVEGLNKGQASNLIWKYFNSLSSK